MNEFRQRRRLPVPLPTPGILALLHRVAWAIEHRPTTALRPGTAPGINYRLPELHSEDGAPFLTLEITVERDREDPTPTPFGWRAARLWEAVFYFKAALFWPASRRG